MTLAHYLPCHRVRAVVLTTHSPLNEATEHTPASTARAEPGVTSQGQLMVTNKIVQET